MSNPTSLVTETTVFPTGIDPNNSTHRYVSVMFTLTVRWQGHLGWVVEWNRHSRLSVKGRKWAYYPPPRNRRFYYFPTYEEALQAALEEVDRLKVNGKTWAEMGAQE